jgi:hypothetical protein
MTARLIKRNPAHGRVGYALYVRAHFDSHRPQYTAAVKSLAAFCDKANRPELVFQVLVSHLDAACKEAVTKS